MKYLILSILVAIALLYPTSCKADEALDHFTAHAGASFGLNYGFYGVFHKWIGMEALPSMLFADTLTFMVGVMYKAMEPGIPPPGSFQRAMVSNTAGIVGANLTMISFKF